MHFHCITSLRLFPSVFITASGRICSLWAAVLRGVHVALRHDERRALLGRNLWTWQLFRWTPIGSCHSVVFLFFSGWPGPHFCLFWGPKHVKEMGTDIFWGRGTPLVFRTSKQCKLHFWGPPPTFCEFWYLVGGWGWEWGFPLNFRGESASR